jgi:hypothetical protein
MNIEERQKLYTYFDGKDHVTEREKYKYFTEKDPYILNLKEQVERIVHQKGLASIMNDTKWLELQESVKKLPFPPPYIQKLVLDETDYKKLILSDAPQYLGDWTPFYNEGLPLFFEIEWMKIRPRYARYRGRLVKPEILDESEQFEQILKECFIPYEEDSGTFTIFGYK